MFGGKKFGQLTDARFCGKSADTGGTLIVTDGRHAGAVALLGNYLAGSFVTTANGHGSTLVTEASSEQRPLLSYPPRG